MIKNETVIANKKGRIKLVLSVVYAFVFPILVFLALEILNTPTSASTSFGSSNRSTIDKLGYLNFTAGFLTILISSVLILLFILIFFAATGNLFLSGLIMSIILVVFYIVNFYRKIMTGFVFVPNDLNLAKQVKTIMSFTELKFDFRILIVIAIISIVLIPLFFASKQIHICSQLRMFCFSIVTGAILFLFFTQQSRENVLPNFGIDTRTRESVNMVYEKSGTLMGFYTVLFINTVEAPQGYSRAYMNRLVNHVSDSAEKYKRIQSQNPNIIIIMSEAFMDPTDLPNVEFSEDPVPNLHMLQENATSGKLLSPSYGGLTCNPEYELITGNAIKFVEYNDTPYYMAEKYLSDDNPKTLVNMFKQNGYKTVGLHTNSIYFYDRNEHYPKFGFDEFIGDEMMSDAKYKGVLPGKELISDEYFTDKIIEQLENAEEPLFLYGISMQNHFEYFPGKYENTTVKAKSDLLTEEQTEYLETYLEGIHDADAQLGRLYEYVENSKTPTIVAFFGDHLPIIKQNTEVFSDLEYVSEHEHPYWTTSETFKMYTTPYVVFSNYQKLPKTFGTISPYFLGALVADASYIEKTVYYSFLMQAYESFHAMKDKIYVDDDDVVYPSPRKADTKILNMFQAFQYDQLFGNNYVEERLSELVK